MSENQGKAADSFTSLMTVSEKAQIVSNQVSEVIAQNMKDHTFGESIIFPVCQKIVSTMLGNEAAMKISKITLYNETANRRILKCLLILRKMYVVINSIVLTLTLQVDESIDVINNVRLIQVHSFH